MESAFEREYVMKTKYKSSAFLKGLESGALHQNGSDSIHSVDAMDAMESNPMQIANQQNSRKRKRSEFERQNRPDDDARFKAFVHEQSFILVLDHIFPNLLDFDSFIQTLTVNHCAIFHGVIEVMNDILLHFIGNEKWWHLSRLMAVYHDLLCHESVRKEFRECFNGELHRKSNGKSTEKETLRKSKKLDFAMNIKYGIYSFLIWICYHHQFTPKPVITFFEDKDSDLQKEGDTPDGDGSHGTVHAKDGADGPMFETLESIKERVIELSIAKSVMIQLLVTLVCAS